MKMKPNYKLPSFQFGFMEVVSAAAYAVAASFLVSITTLFSPKDFFILEVNFLDITSGRTNNLRSTFNIVALQTPVIDRMVYEMVQVNKLLQISLVKKAYLLTPLCAVEL